MDYKILVKGNNHNYKDGFAEIEYLCKTYKDALEKYRKAKERFKDLPVTVYMIKTKDNKIINEKTLNHKTEDIDNLISTLVHAVHILERMKPEMDRLMSSTEKDKEKITHKIESVDYNECTQEELLNELLEFKETLMIRRISKKEVHKYYSFKPIIEEIYKLTESKKFKDNIKKFNIK